MSKAPDLNSLLSRPAGSFKAPPALPAGTWHGVVGSHEFGESSKKKTPFVRYTVNITGASDNVDEEELEGIDLHEKTLKVDFYLTADAAFRLTDFLRSLGLDVDNETMAELIPQAQGQAVMLNVTQRAGEREGEVFNDVKSIVAAS